MKDVIWDDVSNENVYEKSDMGTHSKGMKCGLIKWVKLPNRPPWPAVIDVCPDQNISHRLDCRNDVKKQLVHVHFFGHYDGMSTRGKSVLKFAVNTCIDWKNYDR